MKKLSKVIIIILVISLISACGLINKVKTTKSKNVETADAELNNKEVKEKELLVEVIRKDVKSGDEYLVEKREYNDRGLLTKKVSKDKNGEINGYEIYKYDEKGRVKELTKPKYRVGGKVEITKIYQYDEKGRKTGYILEYEDGKKAGEANYEYYANGNLKYKYIDKAYKGEVRKFYYNKQGKKEKKIINEAILGKAVTEYERNYDEEGDLIRKKEITKVEGREEKQIMIWHYNKFGETDKYITKNGDQITMWIDRKYDEDGNEIKTLFKNSDGEVEEIREYEYDDRGNEVEEIRKDVTNGEDISLWVEREFNKNGNKIKANYKSEEGELLNKLLYKYETKEVIK